MGLNIILRVKEDLKELDRKTKEIIKKTIEEKLTKAPEIFGEKLRGTLKDFWKLRVGNYRIIFFIKYGIAKRLMKILQLKIY